MGRLRTANLDNLLRRWTRNGSRVAHLANKVSSQPEHWNVILSYCNVVVSNLCLFVLIVRFNDGSRPSSGPFLALLLLVNSQFNGFIVRFVCTGISLNLLSKSFVERGLFFLNVELVIIKDAK